MCAEVVFRYKRMKMEITPERPGGASQGLTGLLSTALLSPGFSAWKEQILVGCLRTLSQSHSGRHVWKAGGSGADFQSWPRGQ